MKFKGYHHSISVYINSALPEAVRRMECEETMKHLLAAFLLAILGCRVPNSLPRLGDHFVVPENTTQVMTSSSQTWPSRIIQVDQISYVVAVNQYFQVVYISTHDSRFRTPEGLGLNSTLAQVLATGGRPVVYETGWAHYSELPSGWCAAFYGPLPDLFKAPTSDTKVSHYFKRR